MPFSKEFIFGKRGRKEHLAAKLIATRNALHREGLLLVTNEYKIKVLIPQILAATERIEDGTYGYCLCCGSEIDEERLLKHPHVERCVPCQNEVEKKLKKFS
ncbi:MAG: TraR/DksA family transcriptional regulator [Minisyncoccia bacterium]